MSVIAYDGRFVAVDSQVTLGHLRRTFACKGRWCRVPGGGCVVLTTCGGTEEGLALMQWFAAGADLAQWPAFQNMEDRWAVMPVFKCGVRIVVEEYNQLSIPMTVKESFWAWGGGREVALGALTQGATAEQAVAIACRWRTDCGLPVVVYDLANPPINE